MSKTSYVPSSDCDVIQGPYQWKLLVKQLSYQTTLKNHLLTKYSYNISNINSTCYCYHICKAKMARANEPISNPWLIIMHEKKLSYTNSIASNPPFSQIHVRTIIANIFLLLFYIHSVSETSIVYNDSKNWIIRLGKRSKQTQFHTQR